MATPSDLLFKCVINLFWGMDTAIKRLNKSNGYLLGCDQGHWSKN